MTDREVYEYRDQVLQYIEALGMNPDEELPIVTIKEMREWLDERDEMMREIAKQEQGEDYDPAEREGTIYTDLQKDPQTGLLTTDYFKFYQAEFVYLHLLAEQCFKDPAKVDWKTVTCGYNHKIINTLRHCYCHPLVWTGVTPDLETHYLITGDVAQEVHMPTRVHDDKMMLQDQLTYEGGLLWFADELPKGNHPLVWSLHEPLPAPENMIIWTFITANYGAMPSEDLPEEERDFSLAYFAPQNLRGHMDFIAKHRGGKRAAQIVRILRDDWFEIKAQKMFGMDLISNEQIEQFELALFAGMDRSLRIWDAETPQQDQPKQPKIKPEVQQDRAYMTFKTTGILPAHLMMVCQKLIQVGWIAKDTQPDDFCNLFSGKVNNTKVTWTGTVGKGMLVFLFNAMVKQNKIAVPENYSVTTILEAHFVDPNGAYLTYLNSSKESPKHLPIVKECLDILQLEVDID